MDDWGIKIVFAVGLTALTLLLTGPGLWSERWGWGLFKKRARRSEGAQASPPGAGPRDPQPRP
jgi:hypothetical protein